MYHFFRELKKFLQIFCNLDCPADIKPLILLLKI
jgi:hypothetical protein